MVITLKHYNETFVQVVTEKAVLLEMQEAFSFLVPNYKFQPKVRAGLWDGKIRLINARNGLAPKGLLGQISKFCSDSNYTCEIDDDVKAPFKVDLLSDFSWDNLNLPEYINPYDYQITGVEQALKFKRLILVSATASGKSLMIYAIARQLMAHNARVLVVVPSKGLVAQMRGDFIEYSEHDQWNVDDHTHLIYEGQDKNSDKSLTISTWHSLYKQPKSYLSQFDAVLSDEVHELEAKSGQQLLEKCTNAFVRIGFTGSMRDAKMHELALTGLYGPPLRISSNKELQDRNILADLDIYACILKHPDAKHLGQASYNEEKQHVMDSQKRHQFVVNLADRANGNVLVLFDAVDQHGLPLYQLAQNSFEHKHPLFVYRHTSTDEREQIRQLASERDDLVIFATYGVYQRGINIVNLPNIVLAGPTKSKIRILQSIGRGLRRSQTKTKCTLYDLVDDLKADRKTDNKFLEHFNERYHIYQREAFNVQLVNINL